MGGIQNDVRRKTLPYNTSRVGVGVGVVHMCVPDEVLFQACIAVCLFLHQEPDLRVTGGTPIRVRSPQRWLCVK